MTNEEAIEILNGIAPMPRRCDGKSTTHLLVMEALEMAIKALEQEPCEDCISREEAINEMSNALKRVFVEHRDIAEKAMNKLPSVTPKAGSED